MSFIDRINKEPRVFIMQHLYSICLFFIRIASTLWCRMKMQFWGIKYGKGCSFRGRMLFYREPGATITIGKHCTFNSNSRFNFRGINHISIIQAVNGGRITIGDGFGCSGVSIVSSLKVTIGNNVMCGTNVIIGDRNDHEDLYPEWQPKPIVIGDNVWIGMNCIVMRGVTIGNNVVIGAGSIVTKDIPSNVIAAGCPCRVVKER